MDFLEQDPPNSDYYLRVLSDTIIITVPSAELNYSIINWTFGLLVRPFIQSIKMRMLLRGTISYGPYYLSKTLIIGDAVDDAVYNHDKLKWTGVSLSPTFSKTIDMNYIDTNKAVWYNDIPHKDSHYSDLVLNWPMNISIRNAIISYRMKKAGMLIHRPRRQYFNCLVISSWLTSSLS